MTTATLRDRLAAAEAELHQIADEAKAAHRHWADLDHQQSRKADEVKDLRRRIREENDHG